MGVERFLIFDAGFGLPIFFAGAGFLTVWVVVLLDVSRCLYLGEPTLSQPATHTIPAASSRVSNNLRIFIVFPVGFSFAAHRERLQQLI